MSRTVLEKNKHVDYSGLEVLSKALTRKIGKECRIMVFTEAFEVVWSDRTEHDRENYPVIDEWFLLLQTENEDSTCHYQALKFDKVHRLMRGTDNRYFCPECGTSSS